MVLRYRAPDLAPKFESLPLKELEEAAAAELPWMIAFRRELHQHPELGLEEFETARRIEQELAAIGIPFRRVPPTGIVAVLKGATAGRVVALRADLDALPIDDAKEVPYRSKVPGKMHACGHDVHTAILMGVARILSRRVPLRHGEVRFLFQPAEESVGGAQLLLQAGALEGETIAAIFGLHVDPELEVGAVGIHPGQRNAASDDVRLTVRGRAGHGAYPTSGVDSVVVAAHLVVALQSLVSRGVDAREAIVLTLGTVRGGVAPNVLAPEVVLEGTVRSVGEEVRSRFLGQLSKLAEGVGAAFGATVSVEIEPGYAPVWNQVEATNLVGELAAHILGAEHVQVGRQPRMGVEDFGFYLEQVPGSFYSLGVRNQDRGIVAPAHSSYFDVDEAAMQIGATLQAALAVAVAQGFLDHEADSC